MTLSDEARAPIYEFSTDELYKLAQWLDTNTVRRGLFAEVPPILKDGDTITFKDRGGRELVIKIVPRAINLKI